MTIKNGALAPTGSACVEKVLSRLDKVKANGSGKWKASCPAHSDKTPSLSIKEVGDGTVLLKCWAGCSAADITAAIGLELRDLFPGNKAAHRGPSRAAVEHERAIYQIGLSMLKSSTLSPEDQARFELAKQRLGVVHESA
ncbi:virulence-associated protein E [Pseudomonas sp.]|uniref:virulence-associated protein E n=1 Tax=Pseudomonas sp. TaxID=306 RepID=UPI002D1A5DC1|nr:virulence-associated protein E [Pseudomonas sp.]HUE91485.1 virulence-associated protein E [Pseudomonas sp.]